MSGPNASPWLDQQLLDLAGPPSRRPDPVRPISTAELTAQVRQLAERHSDHQLKAIAANADPGMSSIEDWARSGVSGLQRGATSLLGMFTGSAEGRQQAFNAGVDAGNHLLGRPASSGEGLKAHAQAATSAIGNAIHTLAPGAEPAAGYGPTAAHYDQVVQHYAGPYHQPQSMGGRVAETLGEFAPGALLPGSAAARALRVALPAVAGQAAYEAAPDGYKGAAKFAGSLAGGGVEGMREAAFAPPYATLAKAMPGVTDRQFGLAQALKDHATAQGVNLTNAEVVQQATGGATDLGRVQRLLESTRLTAPRMKAFFADRPAQVDNAIRDFTGRIAPDMPPPGVIGLRGQKAGQGALDFVRRSVNEAADPSYRALPGQTIPPDRYAELASDPAYSHTLSEVRDHPILNGPISHLPDNDLSVVNEVVKRLDRNANASAITQLNPTGDNQLSGAYSSARQRANALASDVSPDWRAARDTVSTGRGAFLDPLEAGPVGKIAASQDLGDQTGALYARNPPVGAPAETAQAVQVLHTQDPDLAAILTRQHMENTWNQSSRALQGGPSQFAGAQYMKDIAGNPEQARTLRAGLDAVDPTGGLTSKYGDLADTLWATGQRQRIGSGTAFNEEDLNALKRAGPIMRAIGGVTDPLEWGKNLSNWTGGLMGAKRLQGLADILLDPDLQGVMAAAREAQRNSLTPVTAALPAGAQLQGSNQ